MPVLELARGADRAPLGHPRGRRLPRPDRRAPGAARLHARTHRSPAASRNLWARRGSTAAADLLRRPHRRGAHRPAGAMDLDSLRADRCATASLRPRRRRHEDLRSPPSSSPSSAFSPPSRQRRLDRPAAHLRRGRRRHRRHGARGRGAQGARRNHRLLHRRRTDLRRAASATRSRTAAAARSRRN